MYSYRSRLFAASAAYFAMRVIAGAWFGSASSDAVLVMDLLAPAVACVVLWRVSRRRTEARRGFWALLSLGCLFYFAALATWDYYLWILGVDPPAIGWAEAFWNAQTLMFLLALWYLMAKERNLFQGATFALDSLIIFVCISTVGWEFVIEPHVQELLRTSDLATIVATSVYPLTDLVIVCSMLVIGYAYKLSLSPKPQLMLNAGFLSFVVADILFVMQYNTNAYAVGNYVDAIYTAGLLLFAAAGAYASSPDKQSVRVERKLLSGWVYGSILLPYTAVVALIALALFHPGPMEPELLVGTIATVTLVMLRQIATMTENRRLLLRMKKLLIETEYAASHDSVSFLPNRALFERTLEEEMQRIGSSQCRALAVLFMDLDRFKFINDSHGHAIGDHLIRLVGERLRRIAGERHMASRRGGDEFTVLLRDPGDFEDIGRWAESLIEEIGKPFHVEGIEVLTTGSVGIAVYPDNGLTLSDLIKNADTAMYKAKELGGNRIYFFTDELNRAFTRQAALELSLRHAIRRDEFLLFYQPIVDARDGRLAGLEALIRWKRKNGTLVSPAEFIPLAEETGLIVPIGEWALRQACMQAREWEVLGMPTLRMAVNVSPVQFEQDGFVEVVRRILRDTGTDPRAITIEITEGVAIRDEESVIGKVNALKALGVRISMDDFGTGYSSLGFLHKLRVDSLKIAQTFTKEIASSAEQESIVRAMMAMARSLGLSVIAEGVETEAQLEFFRKQGCDYIQGYYFAKPMPPEEIRRRYAGPATEAR